MEREEFIKIRHYLGKKQKQMAELLGISLKSIQSFEQGWRDVPSHIERQALFLLHTKRSPDKRYKPCWTILDCSMQIRANCPAWEFQIGHLCWFINGTICHGKVQDSWHEKLEMCRQCTVFGDLLSGLPPIEDIQSQKTVEAEQKQQTTKSLRDNRDKFYTVGYKNQDKSLETAAVGLQEVQITGQGYSRYGLDFKDFFKTIDADQDELVTRADIEVALSRTKHLGNIKNLLSKFWNLDKNHNLKLSSHEMNRAAQVCGLSDQDIKELLEFDTDKDSRLSLGELEKAKEDLTMIQIISDNFDDIDEDGDGIVSLNDINEAWDLLRNMA